MSNINIKFSIENEQWIEYDNDLGENLDNFLKAISKKIKIKELLDQNIDVELSILLTNDDKIRELNKNYRDKDRPTNILAFPIYNINLQTEQNIEEYLFENNLILGDLILSFEYIKKEAKDQGKKLDHHLKHLLLHGLLHLIGYDHLEKSDRNKMEILEIKILEEFGIENPYLTTDMN